MIANESTIEYRRGSRLYHLHHMINCFKKRNCLISCKGYHIATFHICHVIYFSALQEEQQKKQNTSLVKENY